MLLVVLFRASSALPQSICARGVGPNSLRQLCFLEVIVMSLLGKAKDKVVSEPKKKAKGVAWLAGDPNGDAVAKSVKELVRLSAEQKALDAKMDLHKTVVKKYAHESFIQDFTSTGVLPETPMCVQTSDGEKVTYVVQDRSSQYKVSDDQLDALKQLVGDDAADELLYEEVKFSFSRDIMSLPGVTEAIDEALTAVVEKLTKGKKPVLNEEQADRLIEVDKRKTFLPGTLDRVPQLVGRDTQRVRQFVEIMGSCCTRYVKP